LETREEIASTAEEPEVQSDPGFYIENKKAQTGQAGLD
jgi:hypothetical protein